MTKTYLAVLSIICTVTFVFAQDVKLYADDGTYLGKVSSNQYDPESISNPYGKYGSKYSSTSINNPYSKYGSEYSSQSSNNEYTTSAPKMYGSDYNGTEYLGKLSKNRYNSESSSNEYGTYGSEYSNKSINNPYSKWGRATQGYRNNNQNDDCAHQ